MTKSLVAGIHLKKCFGFRKSKFQTNFSEGKADCRGKFEPLFFQKNGRDFQKLQRALNPTELAASVNNLTDEQRMEYLEKTFQETVDEYSKIIERLAAA